MGMDKVQIGRLFGIPILLDVSFILLVVLYGQWYFTSGDMQQISYGLLLVTGIAVSILAHEFGHAFAARYFSVRTSHIELTGLGGLCHFERNLPPGRMTNVVVLLAGPAITAALWLLFDFAGEMASGARDETGAFSGTQRLAGLFNHLGFINYVLLIFNLLPSHPLDGGRALAHILSRWTGYDRAMRAIAYAGFLVVAWLLYQAYLGNYFAIVVAFFLFLANKAVLDSHSGPGLRRWY